MNHGRVRIRSAKGKRWSKGHSSSSNPQTNKHRTAARGKFSDHLAHVGASGRDTLEHQGVALTTNALASLDAIQGDQDEVQFNSEALSNVAVEEEQSDKDEDTSSPSMVSTSTAYSLIETSHPIFGRVKRLWNSGMESHREICAVLAAVSEVVKTSGGEDTVTEYLGTLVTALESADDEKSSTAIAYLLSIVMPKAPVEVLQSRYGVICKVFADKLSSYEMSDSTSLLKSLVTCLTTLLGAQVGSTWNESYTKRVFQLLLNYTLHPKPKLRKAAQNGVVSMLREGTLSGDFHPAARLTATHCLRVIEKGNSEITVLHILGLLKECLANMNAIHIKSLYELILKLISTGNSIIRSTAFKTLHSLFSSVAGPRGLTSQDSAKLISDLYDYQPSLVDAQLLNAWLTVMKAAHSSFSDELCLELLPKLFCCCVDCFMADKAFVKKTSSEMMQEFLRKLGNGNVLETSLCQITDESDSPPTVHEVTHYPLHGRKVNLFQEIGTKYHSFGDLLLEDETGSRVDGIEHKLGRNVEDINRKVFQEWIRGKGKKPVSWDTLVGVLQDIELKTLAVSIQRLKCINKKDTKIIHIELMFRALEGGLKYKFYSSWKYVLLVLATFYQVAGGSKPCQEFMTRSLISLCELRETSNFPFCKELDSAFGCAIKAMGPRVVLNAVPLKLEEESKSCDFPRSWILPILKDHVEATELGYFKESMLPLACNLGTKGKQYLQAGKPLEAKLYNTLQLQVWSLLPGFCTEPVDLSKSFSPDFARILGATLKEAGLQFRHIVCQSLRQLIDRCTRHDEDRIKMASYSKNFLPILFTLYTAPSSEDRCGESEDNRTYLLDCIKVYLSITESTLIESHFLKLMKKLGDSKFTSIRYLLMDLAVVFTPHLSKPSLLALFKYISPLLDSGDVRLQKKAYCCLEVLLVGTTSGHLEIMRENLNSLRRLLVESLSTASAGSKKPRLRCLLHITEHLSEDRESSDFLANIIPEVILCVKEVNEKARLLAYRLVVNLGYAAQHCSGGNSEESIKSYFNLVLAGLAGSPHMISCTLLVLSKLAYEFHDLLGKDLVKRLLSSALMFLSSKSREVVRSTLVFVRVTIGILPPVELAPHVDDMVTSILSWGENKRNHFRLKSRVILEKLVRKFDFEMVSSFVPKKHQKLMAHIRRANEKRKRKKIHLSEERSDEDTNSGDNTRWKNKPSYEELLDSSDDEIEDSRGSRSIQLFKKQKKKEGPASKAWIKEGTEDEPVNFMDPVVVKRVIATDPTKLKSKKLSTFKTDSKGRLLIIDDDQTMSVDVDNAPTDDCNMEVDEPNGGVERKRRLEEDDNLEDQAGTSKGIHRANPHKNDFKDYGLEFRAKKAKGDIKKKGRPDPYAYIPLNRQKLNRRKRAKLTGEFSGIMKKAKKGSATGSRQAHKRRLLNPISLS